MGNAQHNRALPIGDDAYHFEFKTNCLFEGRLHGKLAQAIEVSSMAHDAQRLKKKLKETSKGLWCQCATCKKKTPQGCSKCKQNVHVNAECWNAYHESHALGDQGRNCGRGGTRAATQRKTNKPQKNKQEKRTHRGRGWPNGGAKKGQGQRQYR